MKVKKKDLFVGRAVRRRGLSGILKYDARTRRPGFQSLTRLHRVLAISFGNKTCSFFNTNSLSSVSPDIMCRCDIG